MFGIMMMFFLARENEKKSFSYWLFLLNYILNFGFIYTKFFILYIKILFITVLMKYIFLFKKPQLKCFFFKYFFKP